MPILRLTYFISNGAYKQSQLTKVRRVHLYNSKAKKVFTRENDKAPTNHIRVSNHE